MNTIWNDIKSNFKNGSSFTRLLYINLGFFLVYKILTVFGFLFQIENTYDFVHNYLALPSVTNSFINKPWTLISYMFVHQDFLHIFFNLVCLYFGSKLFLQYFTSKQLVSTYILGGIFGGLIYIIAFNVFPVFKSFPYVGSVAIGASASVLAIFISYITYNPNKKVYFTERTKWLLALFGIIIVLFKRDPAPFDIQDIIRGIQLAIGGWIIGYILHTYLKNIRIKYIAILFLLLSILSINSSNSGGHIAHLGGALFGFIYILFLKKGTDLSINFYDLIGFLNFTKTRKPRKKSRKKRSSKGNDDLFRSKKSEKQKKINIVLEKISKSGYDSLTKEEKELLFKESK